MKKQGRADTSGMGGQKREPIPHAINPGGADRLGQAIYQNPTPLGAGRGYSAPAPVAKTIHPSGSQGKRR